MIRRAILPVLQERLAGYPAVALVGPRQSGKTTLAKSLSGVYFDLEQETDRLRLDLEWDKLLDGRKLIILDEAQAWPEVFENCAAPSTKIDAARADSCYWGRYRPRLWYKSPSRWQAASRSCN